MVNIVCTSKPVDGLLYYSYEYCCLLNSAGIDARLIIICHKDFSKEDYLNAITHKYIHCNNIFFDDCIPGEDTTTLILGRSMMTLSWIEFRFYSESQQKLLLKLFSKKIIAVYSENHPVEYSKALEFYSPLKIIDLCDTEVYPHGTGEYFEKRIYFDIYKPYINNIKFKYLFTGTNSKYYASAEKVIGNFPDHGILVYNNSRYLNPKNNHVFSPVEHLMGMFDTYVYVKETFDPAPRIIQECKYFGKNIIYLRNLGFEDGGSVYWRRDVKMPDINPIVKALDLINNKQL